MTPPFPPRNGDLPFDKLVVEMDKLLAKGYHVWVKWTCPDCGERATSNEPDVVHTGGYLHQEKADGTPCGAWYFGTVFGMRAEMTVNPKPPQETT